ncbi:MAG: hypothetical protein WKF30_18340 [Pyrinomonadaceae bacterium]
MPVNPPARICFRCGAQLIAGGLAYQVRVEMSADFDGYLDGDIYANSLAAMQTALQAAATESEEELNDQVHRERKFLFCHICAEQVWNIVARPSVYGFNG